MLDIAIIREEPDRVKQAMRDLNDEEALTRIDFVLELDEKRRKLLGDVEAMRGQKNEASKRIGISRDPKERETKIAEMKSLNARLDKQEAALREIQADLDEQILWIPNIPANG